MSDEIRPVPLRRSDLDRVIRRAAELQFQEPDAGTPSAEGMTEEEILRIGAEVGLDASHLRRALGELRAETLVPSTETESGLPARLVGPSRVHAARAVAGTVEGLGPRLHAWLRDEESLTPLRERVGSSVWEPNQGMKAQFQRGFNFSGRSYELARVKALEVSLVPLEEGWVLVTLVADVSNLRREHGLGWGLGVGLSSAGVGLGVALVASFPAVAVVGVALAAGLGGGGAGTTLARQTFAPARNRMSLALEGLLDRCERGEFKTASRRDLTFLGLLDR